MKNHEVRIKLSKEELEKIKDKAFKLGLSISAFLRLLGLNSDIEVTKIH
mgnify:CR=1 FL=1